MQLHDEIKEPCVLICVQIANDIDMLYMAEDMNLHWNQAHLWIFGPTMHGNLVTKDELDSHLPAV